MDKYENGRTVIEGLKNEFDKLDKAQLNEADTRLRFIDQILINCLCWDTNSINCEDYRDGEYADYKLSLFRPVAVVEAKKTGNYFELPVGNSKIIYPLRSNVIKLSVKC